LLLYIILSPTLGGNNNINHYSLGPWGLFRWLPPFWKHLLLLMVLLQNDVYRGVATTPSIGHSSRVTEVQQPPPQPLFCQFAAVSIPSICTPLLYTLAPLVGPLSEQ